MPKHPKLHLKDPEGIEDCRLTLEDLKKEVRVMRSRQGEVKEVLLTPHAKDMLRYDPYLLPVRIEEKTLEALQEKYGEEAIASYPYKLDIELLQKRFHTQGAAQLFVNLEAMPEPARKPAIMLH